MSFTRLPPPGDRPALLNAPRETLLIRVSRCHLWLLRLLSQPAPPWPQEWLLQAAAPASLSARRVQPLEPIRSLLAPTPEQTVLIAATLAKPVSQISANAKTITEDLDARYEAFADAEAFLIENALVIPLGMPVPPYIATRLNLWEGQYAPTGLSTNRLKGVHILDHYVSMDEYNANRDAR